MNMMLVLAIVGVVALIIGGIVFIWFKKNPKKFGNNNEVKDSIFWSRKEFYKKNKKNIVNTKDLVVGQEADFLPGILIGSGKARKVKLPSFIAPFKCKSKFGKSVDIEAVLLPWSHVLIFGSTGSGKSNTLLMPTILLNSFSKVGPSGFVADPKGEIYNLLAPILNANGYKVIYLNLTDTTRSDRWNPFELAITSGIKHVKSYVLLNKLNDEDLVKELKSNTDRFYRLAFESMNQTSRTLIEIASGKDKSVWTTSAIDLFLTNCRTILEYIIAAASEKVLAHIEQNNDKYFKEEITKQNYERIQKEIDDDKEIDDICEECFSFVNFKNITSILKTTDKEEWLKFCQIQGWHDKMGLFTAHDEQYNSFQMNVSAGLSNFIGPNFEDLLYKSDFSYEDFIERKTIIFVNLPTGDESKSSLAVLMIEQLWNYLFKISSFEEGSSLPRPFYFYWDELANMPESKVLLPLLTIGRSKKIFGAIVIQSLAQLNKIYGQNTEQIITGNTMGRVYLYDPDSASREYISKQYGTRTMIREDGQMVEKPLLSVEELGKVKPGIGLYMPNRENCIFNGFASIDDYKFLTEYYRNAFGGDE